MVSPNFSIAWITLAVGTSSRLYKIHVLLAGCRIKMEDKPMWKMLFVMARKTQRPSQGGASQSAILGLLAARLHPYTPNSMLSLTLTMST